MQFISLEQSIVEKLCIVEFKMQRRLNVALERAIRKFGAPGTDGVGKVMLADQSLSNHVRVCERSDTVRKEMCEVDIFIRSNL